MGKLSDYFTKRGWGLVHRGFARLWLASEIDFHGEEVLETSDSVALLVFDKTSRELVFVNQKRPAMVRPENPEAIINEVLAGRFDVKIGVRGLMVKEAKEELGLTVSAEEIELLNNGDPLALSPGILTERMYVGYVEASSARFADGDTFGVDVGEVTRPVRIPVDHLDEVVWDDMKTWALVQWFIANKLRS